VSAARKLTRAQAFKLAVEAPPGQHGHVYRRLLDQSHWDAATSLIHREDLDLAGFTSLTPTDRDRAALLRHPATLGWVVTETPIIHRILWSGAADYLVRPSMYGVLSRKNRMRLALDYLRVFISMDGEPESSDPSDVRAWSAREWMRGEPLEGFDEYVIQTPGVAVEETVGQMIRTARLRKHEGQSTVEWLAALAGLFHLERSRYSVVSARASAGPLRHAFFDLLDELYGPLPD
jgi:hypothetical protein